MRSRTPQRANLALSSQLPYILAASRFAHYLKCLMRDRIGAFTEPSVIQSELAAWLSQYTLLDERAGLDLKARHRFATWRWPSESGRQAGAAGGRRQAGYQVEDQRRRTPVGGSPALISSAPPSAGRGPPHCDQAREPLGFPFACTRAEVLRARTP